MTDASKRIPLVLTTRALRDLREIVAYSSENWDQDVAERYLNDLEAALTRCSGQPGLLRSREDLHPNLRFYVVNRHVLVCDVTEKSIVVLTVANARMDLVSQLARLEPTLSSEVEILRSKIREGAG